MRHRPAPDQIVRHDASPGTGLHLSGLGQLTILVALALVMACSDTQGVHRTAFRIDDQHLRVLSGDSLLYDIRDLALSRDGGIWVLSATAPFIYHFTSEGDLKASFGREGPGPGELQAPWSIMVGPRQGVVVWDVGSRRLIPIAEKGKLAVSQATRVPFQSPLVSGDIARTSYGSPLHMVAWPTGGYLIQQPTQTVNQTGDLRTLLLLRLNRSGSPVDTLLHLRGGNVQGGEAAVFATIPLWTQCPDGELVVFNPAASELLRIAPNGEVTATEHVEIPKKSIDDQDIRAFLRQQFALETGIGELPARAERRISGIIHEQRGRFAAVAPPAVRVLCDSYRNVWLQQFSTGMNPAGLGRMWFVEREDGQPLQVTFPRFFQPLYIGTGRAVGVYTDSLDIEHLAFTEFPDRLESALEAAP